MIDEKLTLTKTGFIYGGREYTLGGRAILLKMPTSGESPAPHVYHDVCKAFDCYELNNADEDSPVTIYVAPGVYWLHDPFDEKTVRKSDGYDLPYGVHVKCKALKLVGLSGDPRDAVIAANRGQSHGSDGNYTMFRFDVEKLTVSNLTVGNYCSVDLVYPRDPSQNRARRTEAVTQAQLAIQSGQSLFAENCRFVSRLNLCPICGAKKALYRSCHFECTDDSLNGDAVHVGCDFDLYGGRPIYQTGRSGAVFIDCDFRIHNGGGQYLTKEGGPAAMINCRFEGSPRELGWTKYPSASLKCYQSGVTLNKSPVTLGKDGAPESVDIAARPALGAYILPDGNPNLENLLGEPKLPTLLELAPSRAEIVSGSEGVFLDAGSRFFNGEPCPEKVSFSVCEDDEDCVALRDDGGRVYVSGKNSGPDIRRVVVTAVSQSGLEAAAEIFVAPYPVSAPTVKDLKLRQSGGALTLEYNLSVKCRRDISEISWYRDDGGGRKLCAVSKEVPLKVYRPTEADAGRRIRAVIVPKVIGSEAGEPEEVVSEPIENVTLYQIFTDFSDIPEKTFPNEPGRWIIDSAKPEDVIPHSESFGDWYFDAAPPYKYGATGNGSIGKGFYQNVQGARLRYTPVHRPNGNKMRLTVVCDPAKTAGQGLGSAGQYIDFGLNFDSETLSGPALRAIRLKDASDAVSMALVNYDRGRAEYLTGLVRTSCFITGCSVRLCFDGKKLTADVGTSSPIPAEKTKKGYAERVHLEAEPPCAPGCGIMIWHTGSPGSGGWQNTVMLHSVEAEWG